jgi:hypothetical protein
MGFLDLFRGRPTIVEGTEKLPKASRRIDIGDPIAGTGKQIVLCRVEGALYALDARCPHEGAGSATVRSSTAARDVPAAPLPVRSEDGKAVGRCAATRRPTA